MIKLQLIFLITCSVIQCKTPQGNVKSLEVMEPGNETELTDFPLGFAKKNNIPHKVFKVQADKKKRIDSSFIKIEFGKLNKTNYDLLMKNYRGDGNVPFEPNRTYELLDFLPAKMQALANRWMTVTGEIEPKLPAEYGMGLDRTLPVIVNSGGFNCWVTVSEIMRDLNLPLAQKKAKIYFFPIFMYEQEVLNNKTIQESSVVLSPNVRTQTEENFKLRNTDRKFGDVMGIRFAQDTAQDLAHTAIWVDDDLCFEKTNIGYSQPIRLARWNDVVENYNDPLKEQAANFNKDSEVPSIQFIRFKSDLTFKLPDPEKFSIGADIAANKGKLFPSRQEEIDLINNSMRTSVKFPQEVISAKAFRPIPSELANLLISELGLGDIDGLNFHKIKTFGLVADPATKRMKLDGFEKLADAFESSNILCVNDDRDENKFDYLITTDYQLSIKDKVTGKFVVSAVKGKAPASDNPAASGEKSNRKILAAEYKIGDKTISIFEGLSEFGFEEVLLNHPGVQENVDLKCAQDGLVFNQIPK